MTNIVHKTQEDSNSVPLQGLGVVKICGMKNPSNILVVAALEPDFMGFIFYPKSPRYAEHLDRSTLDSLPKSIKTGDLLRKTVFCLHRCGRKTVRSRLAQKQSGRTTKALLAHEVL